MGEDNQTNEESYYKILGVSSFATTAEIRKAYRDLAKSSHPDLQNGDTNKMQLINRAWLILSDEKSRNSYDKTMLDAAATESGLSTTQPAPETKKSRRKAWAQGVKQQIERLAIQAGRSATQTLLTKYPIGQRFEYDEIVYELADLISADTEARVRSARAAGAAPLDLGVASTLVGIKFVADGLRRLNIFTYTRQEKMQADLLDRMWDVLAHELPHELVKTLGGNPNISKNT